MGSDFISGLEDLISAPPQAPAEEPTSAGLGADPSKTLMREAVRYGLKKRSGLRSRAEQNSLIRQGKTKATDSFHLYSGDSGALDFVGQPQKMVDYTRDMHAKYGPELAELLHEPAGNWKYGKPVPLGSKHQTHVHIAWGNRGRANPDQLSSVTGQQPTPDLASGLEDLIQAPTSQEPHAAAASDFTAGLEDLVQAPAPPTQAQQPPAPNLSQIDAQSVLADKTPGRQPVPRGIESPGQQQASLEGYTPGELPNVEPHTRELDLSEPDKPMVMTTGGQLPGSPAPAVPQRQTPQGGIPAAPTGTRISTPQGMASGAGATFPVKDIEAMRRKGVSDARILRSIQDSVARQMGLSDSDIAVLMEKHGGVHPLSNIVEGGGNDSPTSLDAIIRQGRSASGKAEFLIRPEVIQEIQADAKELLNPTESQALATKQPHLYEGFIPGLDTARELANRPEVLMARELLSGPGGDIAETIAGAADKIAPSVIPTPFKVAVKGVRDIAKSAEPIDTAIAASEAFATNAEQAMLSGMTAPFKGIASLRSALGSRGGKGTVTQWLRQLGGIGENVDISTSGVKLRDPNDPSYRKEQSQKTSESIPGQFGQAIGSSLTMMLQGQGLSEVLGMSGSAGAATIGALQQSGQTFDEALQKGATQEEAANASIFGALIGLSEGFGVGGALDRIALKKVSSNLAKEFLKEGGEEFIQEGFQNFAQNVLAHLTYDPQQGVFTKEALLKNLEQATVAFATGGILGGGGHAFSSVKGRIKDDYTQWSTEQRLAAGKSVSPEQFLKYHDAVERDKARKAGIEVGEDEAPGTILERVKAQRDTTLGRPAPSIVPGAEKARGKETASADQTELRGPGGREAITRAEEGTQAGAAVEEPAKGPQAAAVATEEIAQTKGGEEIAQRTGKSIQQQAGPHGEGDTAVGDEARSVAGESQVDRIRDSAKASQRAEEGQIEQPAKGAALETAPPQRNIAATAERVRSTSVVVEKFYNAFDKLRSAVTQNQKASQIASLKEMRRNVSDRGARALFTEETGIKLPASKAGSGEALTRWMKSGTPLVTRPGTSTAVEGGLPVSSAPVKSDIRSVKEGAVVAEAPAVIPGEAGRLKRERVERRQAERERDTDELTGLQSKRTWTLAEEAVNKNPDRAVIQVDLNQFKLLNDTHGHKAGDAALKKYAAAVQKAVPKAQIIARTGGDEITIALPATIAPAAAKLLKAIQVKEGSITISGSVGHGATYAEADAAASAHKTELKKAGIIGERGQAATGAAKKPTVDTAAREAATSPENKLPQPTEAQKEAGNFQKGHTQVGGLDIAIENPEGSRRRPEWPVLKSHYGYIKRTGGADGEQVDAFIKPGTATEHDGPVFVVNQTKGNGQFDEHKAMVGWPTEKAARAAYLESYTKGWDRIKSIARFENPTDFKEWLDKGDLMKPAPTKGERFKQTLETRKAAKAPPKEQPAARTPSRGSASPEVEKKLASVRDQNAKDAEDFKKEFARLRGDALAEAANVPAGWDKAEGGAKTVTAPATAEWREKRGYLAMNVGGLRALSKAYQSWLNLPPSMNVNGLTLQRTSAIKLAFAAEALAKRVKGPAAARDLRTIATALRDAAGRREELTIIPKTGFAGRQTIRHELTHEAQIALERFFAVSPTREQVESLPHFEKAKAALVARGYGHFADNPQSMTKEIAAHVAAGQGGLAGLSVPEGVQFLRGYFEHIATMYRSDALARFKDLTAAHREVRDAVRGETRAAEQQREAAGRGQREGRGAIEGVSRIPERGRQGTTEVSAQAGLKEEEDKQVSTTLAHVAWHGSPHKFDKFTIDHMGTGEGAQAYGWGLYFAGNEAVARYYKEALAPRRNVINNARRHIKPDYADPEFRASLKTYLKEHAPLMSSGIDLDKAVDYVIENYTRGQSPNLFSFFGDNRVAGKKRRFDSEHNAVHKFLDNHREDFYERAGQNARLYKVDLKPAEDEYLLWDKPLIEQSDKAKAALRGYRLPDAATGKQIYDMLKHRAMSALEPSERNGLESYAENASKSLLSGGIKGIKYLDGSSRSQGEGSHNYVIFDDADIVIGQAFPFIEKAKAKQTETPEFKKWFGDSKVVDAKGEPLVVYHGTASMDIEHFLPRGFGQEKADEVLSSFRRAQGQNRKFGYMNFRGGTFFSPHPDYAGRYTGEGRGAIYPVFIKAENPVYFDQKTGKVTGTDLRGTPDALIMHEGGVINEIAVIDPKQIKSATGNIGAFDPESANILAELRPQEALPPALRDPLARIARRFVENGLTDFDQLAGEFEELLGPDAFDEIAEHLPGILEEEQAKFEGKSPVQDTALVPRGANATAVPDLKMAMQPTGTQIRLEFTRYPSLVTDQQLRSLFPESKITIRRTKNAFSPDRQGVELTFWDSTQARQVKPPADWKERIGLGAEMFRGQEPVLAVESREYPPVVRRALTQSIVDIGQLSKQDKRDLLKAMKAGVIVKGKGGPFPASKTVYAHPGYDFDAERARLIEEVRSGRNVRTPLSLKAADTEPPDRSSSESGFATPDLLGVGEVLGGAKKVGEAFGSLRDDFRRIFNPSSRSPEAKSAALMTREYAATKQRSLDQVDHALKSARKLFSKTEVADRYGFIDNFERGRAQADPALQSVADTFRSILDADRDAVQGLGTGKLEQFNADYMPRYWEKGKGTPGESHTKRPLEGSKGFLKRRSYEFFKDGIDAGETPLSDNPVDFVMWKHAEMQQYIAAHRILNEMKGSGMARFARTHQDAPDAWRTPKDNLFAVWGRGENGETILRGHYYLPDGATHIVDNYTSKGLRGKAWFRAYLTAGNLINQMQLGFSAFHAAFVSLDAIISNNALALYQVAHGNPIRGISTLTQSPLAPMLYAMKGRQMRQEWLTPGRHPELAPIVDAMLAGGGRSQMDKFYRTEITRRIGDAFRRGTLLGFAEGILRIPMAAAELSAKPVMEWMVPNMKVGAIAKMAEYELRRLGPNASRETVRDAMAKVVDSVDNRMGQMIYDNLFWNKVAKDLGMASVRSLGWNLGDIREFGGGAADVLGQIKRIASGKMPEVTHRMSYMVLLPVTVGIIGAALMYLLTGRRPEEPKDYFYPQTGATDENGDPERIALPSYMKDIYPLVSQRDAKATVKTGLQMASHKVHPLLRVLAEMLENKDYYGTEIRHSDDPIIQQAKDSLKQVGKSLVPMGISGFMKEQERGGAKAKQLLPLVGITPAPRAINQTPAEKLMGEMLEAQRPTGTHTKAEFEHSKLKREATRAVQTGNPEGLEMIKRAHEAGLLTDKDLTDIRKRGQKPPVARAFADLGISDALKVWDIASSKERSLLKPLLEKKSRLILNVPEAERAPLEQRFQRALSLDEQGMKEAMSLARHSKVKSPGDAEKALLVRADAVRDETLAKMSNRPQYQSLSEDQQKSARRQLTDMMKAFSITKEIQAMKPEGRKARAEKSLMVLENWYQRGILDMQIDKMIERAKKRAA